jgi:hypothetical protein
LAVSSANSGTRRINSRLDNIDIAEIPSGAGPLDRFLQSAR